MATDWQADLTRRITETLRDGAWDLTLSTYPAMEPSRGRELPVDLGRMPSVPHALLVRLVGRVNAGEFCGAPPGTLLLTKTRSIIEEDAPRLRLTFVLREGPWNFLQVAPGDWREWINSAGDPLYGKAEFGELIEAFHGETPPPQDEGGSWRDRPPLL